MRQHEANSQKLKDCEYGCFVCRSGMLIMVTVRFALKDMEKEFDKTEEDIKALCQLEKETHIRFCKPYWTGWGNIGFPDLE